MLERCSAPPDNKSLTPVSSLSLLLLYCTSTYLSLADCSLSILAWTKALSPLLGGGCLLVGRSVVVPRKKRSAKISTVSLSLWWRIEHGWAGGRGGRGAFVIVHKYVPAAWRGSEGILSVFSISGKDIEKGVLVGVGGGQNN